MWAAKMYWMANMESGMSMEQCEYHLVCPWKACIAQHLFFSVNFLLCQTVGEANL